METYALGRSHLCSKWSSFHRTRFRLPHAIFFGLLCIDGKATYTRLYISFFSAAKADRLKQAKQEAEKEIKAYKAQREEAFQKRMSDVSPIFTSLALAALPPWPASSETCFSQSRTVKWVQKQYAADPVQDSSTSGANVKRLESESAASVKNIEKSIASKKKEVRRDCRYLQARNSVAVQCK